MKNNKPTVFLLNLHPFVTRNICDSGVLEILSKEAKVVLLVMDYKEEYFREKYSNLDVVVEGLDNKKILETKYNPEFEKIAELLVDTKVKQYHKMVLHEKLHQHAKYYITVFITKVFGNISLFRKLFRYVDNKVVRTSYFDLLFEKYNPDIVFATDIFSDNNALLIRRAKELGIKDVGMTRSWDNTSTKVYLRTKPSKILVQNEQIRKEMTWWHDVKHKEMNLTGVPQYEAFLKHKPNTREEFCKKTGLNPTKRIVVYSPASNVFIDNDWQICEILRNLHRDKKIPQDIQFLVRPHPYNDTDLSKFEGGDNFIVEKPQTALATDKHKEREAGEESFVHLANTIYHADLIVNVVSSMIIDCMAFDKPIITIGFNGFEKNTPFLRSVERWQSEECVEYFLSEGASPHVKGVEELEEWINKYLTDSSIHKKERNKLLERHTWKYDGGANERIKKLILE